MNNTENKAIRILLQGIGTEPSEHLEKDSVVSESINVRSAFNESAPVCMPVDKSADYGLSNITGKVIYIHKGNAIVLHGGNEYHWRSSTGGNDLFATDDPFKSVTSMGNTLIISTENDVWYFLWKDGAYLSLGNSIPAPDIAFYASPVANEDIYGLKSRNNGDVALTAPVDWVDLAHVYSGTETQKYLLPYSLERWNTTGDGELNATEPTEDYKSTFELDDNERWVTPSGFVSAVWDAIDQMTGGNQRNGYANFPHFLIAAVRLYDGSYTKVSAPIFVDTSTENHVVDATNYTLGSTRTSGGTTSTDTSVRTSGNGATYSGGVAGSARGASGRLPGPSEKYPSTLGAIPIEDEGTYGYIRVALSYEKEKYGQRGHKQYINASVKLLETYRICAFIKDAMSRFEGWEDIVKGVDIFISTAVNPHVYKNKAKLYGLKSTSTEEWTYTYSSSASSGSGSTSTTTKTVSVDASGYANLLLDPVSYLDEPEKVITSHSEFYLLKSFDIDELQQLSVSDSHVTESGEGLVYTFDENLRDDWLVTQKQLPYSYQSSHDIISVNSSVYNQRLLAYGIVQRLTSGYPYLNGLKIGDNSVKYRFRFNLDTDSDGSKKVDGLYESGSVWYEGSIGDINGSLMVFLSYPDSRCKSVNVLYSTSSDGKVLYEKTYSMKVFGNLDASYCFIGFYKQFISEEGAKSSVTETVFSDDENNIETVTDRLWLSEVANPFVFPAEGRHAVGDGDIIGAAPATIALSENQYGNYPLYVFTTEGIWGLPVAQDGTLTSVPPSISRDVCNNPSSITCIDKAVVFTTSRGLHYVSDYRVTDITPWMKGRNGKSEEMLAELLAGTDWGEPYLLSSGNTSFISYLDGAHIAYDYPGGRLVVIREGSPYQYAYLFASQSWHKVCTGLEMGAPVNSYPGCLVNVTGTYGVRLYDICTNLDLSDSSLVSLPGVVVTRALDFDNPDVYKSITRLEVRGDYDKGDVKYVLFGSNDNRNWTMLHSLRGPSWRWYKIAVLSSLSADEKVSYIEIQYQERYKSRLR